MRATFRLLLRGSAPGKVGRSSDTVADSPLMLAHHRSAVAPCSPWQHPALVPVRAMRSSSGACQQCGCGSYLVVGGVHMVSTDVGIGLDVVGIKHAQNYPAEDHRIQL